MSDEVDFDMETVEGDELDELGAGGTSNSEECPRSWSEESKEAGTEGSDKRSEEVRKGRLSDLQGASVSPSKSEKGTELINGVLWSKVGSIPDGWEFVNLGPEVSIQTGYNAPSKNFIEEGGIPLIRNRDLGSEETEIQYDGDYGEEYLIEDGDLLVSMDGEFEPHLWTGGKALLNQRVCKIEGSDRYSHIFLAYAIEKPLYLLQKSIAGTTVKHLSKSNIRSVNLPTPPLPEQRKIASVLYAVDQAIQKTEAIIEQAERVKRGLMQRLLRKGIGNHSLMDTGTDLKTLPKHWESVPLSDAIAPGEYTFTDGARQTLRADEIHEEGEARVILLQEVGVGSFSDKNPKFATQKKYEEIEHRAIYPGEVVIAKMADPVARACLIPDTYDRYLLGCADVVRVEVDEDYDSRFLMYCMNSHEVWKQAAAHLRAAGRNRINLENIAELYIPKPPVEEQKEIANRLATFDTQLEKERDAVSFLKRLKKGLMQDLLTGEVRTANKAIEVLDEVKAHG